MNGEITITDIDDTEELTIEMVKGTVPRSHRSAVTQSLVDKLNKLSSDEDTARSIRENFVSYLGILKEGRFKLDDYLHAVNYVSYKLMRLTNENAWAKTFPERYNRLVAKGTPKKDIASHVVAYNKGKLVNMIYEQTMIPIYVLNQDAVQKAINTQVELMSTSGSDLVRTQAANSLLTHLKKPESQKATLDINVNESKELQSMKETITQLAEQQQIAIQENRMKTIDVTEADIIRPTSENDDE